MTNLCQLTREFELHQRERKLTQVHASSDQTEAQVPEHKGNLFGTREHKMVNNSTRLFHGLHSYRP